MEIWAIHSSDWIIQFQSHYWPYRGQNNSTRTHNNPKFMGKPAAISQLHEEGNATCMKVNSHSQTHNMKRTTHSKIPKTNIHTLETSICLRERAQRGCLMMRGNVQGPQSWMRTTHSKIVKVRKLSQFFAWVKMKNGGCGPFSSCPCEDEHAPWWSVHVGKDWQSYHTPLSMQ